MSRVAAAVVLTCAIAIVLAARPSAHDPITTKVTWSREIVRIIEPHCGGCHVAGGVAPMPLGTYEETRPWLRAVRDEVVARRMPKWPAARGLGDFANDRSLSPFEIELIAAWVDGGAPKGDARDLPKAPPAASPQVAPAGVTLALPARTSAPAGERRTVRVATGLARERWMTGWRFQPNDAAIGQVEFSLEDGTYLGNWVPPEGAVSLPPDTGLRLPAGAALGITLWYRTARAQQDFPVGLPARAPAITLSLAAAAPAREAHTLDAACGRTPAPDGELFAVRPMTTPHATIGIALRPPDGPPRVLAWVREFDSAYQATLRLRDAVGIVAGETVEVASGDAACHAYVHYASTRR